MYKKHLQEYLKDYPNLTIQSGSVADLVLNDQVTQEEHNSMVLKGASQIVKGVRLGKLFVFVHLCMFVTQADQLYGCGGK